MNSKLTRDDLVQMNRPYFERLEHEILVNVACNLHELSVELIERLEKNSRNSNRPPSSDNPFKKGGEKKEAESDNPGISAEDADESGKDRIPEESSIDSHILLNDSESPVEEGGVEDEADTPAPASAPNPDKRSPGKQAGAQGFWREDPLIPECTVRHYPEKCAACSRILLPDPEAKLHMGHHVLDLERTEKGSRVVCTLHQYVGIVCECGHESRAYPGEGQVFKLESRKKDLKLTEYVLVGPMLATFIAALSLRYRMSRAKIREFLYYWYGTQLSVGTIDRCIREAGLSSLPVVDSLLEELQEAEIINIDETPWYEKGQLKWLWVAVSTLTVVYIIGSRKKEEMLKLITTAFLGWLITDGYGAYRSHEKRQRCLAHLIRKAVALTGGVSEDAVRMGEWLLRELRGLIAAISEGGEDTKKKCRPILARLKRACYRGCEIEIPNLKALCREILNDWDAVVAFVKNPGLPCTNNNAERALRHAVISRRISFGTRTSEGTQAYASLLSVIETCRLRGVDPWNYIAEMISLGRKGCPPQPIPMPN